MIVILASFHFIRVPDNLLKLQVIINEYNEQQHSFILQLGYVLQPANMQYNILKK